MKTSNKILLGTFLVIIFSFIALLIAARTSLEPFDGNFNEHDRDNSIVYEGNGTRGQIAPTVAAFNGLKVEGAMEVKIARGEQAVRIEADENLLEHIVSKVDKGMLKISIKDNVGMKMEGSIKVWINTNSLTSISQNGIAKVEFIDHFNVEDFHLELYGNSRTTLKLTGKNINVNGNGAVNVKMIGSAEQLTVDLSGSSSLDAEELEAKKVGLMANGGIDFKVFAVDELRINSSGNTSVYYKGQPKMYQSSSGSLEIGLID